MTSFELRYLIAEPFLPPLWRSVRRRLLRAVRSTGRRAAILDVGGRKSHYTIGVRGDVTITDLPRETELQESLTLGISPVIARETLARRTNVREVLIDDMTCSALPSETFDIVVAVEVLEHVEDDVGFLSNVARVLRPGGRFLMTTPNGDAIPTANPGHVRHYGLAELEGLLCDGFTEVSVEYAILGGRLRAAGLRPWSLRHPLGTIMSMCANLANGIESSAPWVRKRPCSTRHLIATARKGVPIDRADSLGHRVQT